MRKAKRTKPSRKTNDRIARETLYKKLIVFEYMAEQTARQVEELSHAVDRLHHTVVQCFQTPQAS